VEACPPFRVRLPMDGGHGARAPFAHPGVNFKQRHLRTHFRGLAVRLLEVYPRTSRLLKIRGRRECRAPDAPAAARVVQSTRVSDHGLTPEVPGIPRAMVLTAYFRASPVTGLFCHRHFRELCPRKLSASVGAPGPHDFAVRASVARLATPPRPPHHAPRS
jgi:hypothetical protein